MTRLRVHLRAARFVQDTRVFLIRLRVGMASSFSKETIFLTNSVYAIINGLSQVLFECALSVAYKGTRRKHNMKFRQIGYTTSQYIYSRFPKTISAWNGLIFTDSPSLTVFRSNFFSTSVHLIH